MPRTNPSINLRWAETHVVVKAILANGTTLRLGTAKLENVPEEDSNLYAYAAKIKKDSEIGITITQGANSATFEAINVDKTLGLTINDVASVLSGAKVVCSKVFASPETFSPSVLSPNIWFKTKHSQSTANSLITEWEDENGIIASGSGTFILNQINGLPVVKFEAGRSMTIPGVFPIAQMFAVFKSTLPTFTKGSILGSDNLSNRLFGFAGGTTAMENPFPREVRRNGEILSNPFDLGDITNTIILNVKTNNPTVSRPYRINNMEGFMTNFSLAELIGFDTDLTVQQEKYIETYLGKRFGIDLPYLYQPIWERKVMLVGEISTTENDQQSVILKIVSDTAPNTAFISSRPIQTNCPLVFKGPKCGYVGPLTTCNKLYQSDDGCSGRANQHRFGGLVVKGELNRVIGGGIDTGIGDGHRFPRHDLFPDPLPGRNRIPFID